MNNKNLESLISSLGTINNPGIHFLGVYHDPGCPKTIGDSFCTCKEVDIARMTEAEWINHETSSRRQRRKALRAAEKAIRKAKK